MLLPPVSPPRVVSPEVLAVVVGAPVLLLVLVLGDAVVAGSALLVLGGSDSDDALELASPISGGESVHPPEARMPVSSSGNRGR